MKILLLADRIPPENRGGAGEIVWRLALGLRDSGHIVHIAVATEKASFMELRDGIATHHLHSQYHVRWRAYLSLYNPQVMPSLRALYARIQPDVVNAHNIHSDLGYGALTLAHQMGIRTVFTSHDVMPFAYTKLSYFVTADTCDVAPEKYRLPLFFNVRQNGLRYNPVRNRVIRHILTQHVDVRVAVSDELAKAHSANDLPPFQTVHNGIDVTRWQRNETLINSLRERLNLHNRKIILFGGRLTNAKGMAQLLSALQKVVVLVPNVTLLVLSPTPIEQQITQPQWQTLREQHMVAGGWLTGEELASAYHISDVIVAPSVIFDSFPTVILEAMACHKPVIATCFGGGKEALVDGETGYLVNPLQVDDFADKLIRLLSDSALAQAMGDAGYERVTQQYPVEQWIKQTLSHFSSSTTSHT